MTNVNVSIILKRMNFVATGNDHVITRHVSRKVDSRFKYIIRDRTDDRLNRVFYHKRFQLSSNMFHFM